ncbi:hypothetical protein DRQ29_04425 [bacterium]|nr:MAG: hypothetical protein DRQ29_04425 [bacterium]
MKKNLSKMSEEIGYIPDELAERVKSAADISWRNFGKKIKFYLPGMFILYGKRGKYPAVSVTGAECELQCKHCKGRLLKPMPPARNSEELLALARKWKNDGIEGILLSGGSTKDGYVPLYPILPAVPKLKEMGFYISAHTGYATQELAKAVAKAGVDQVLIDVVGDDETMRNILNLDGGVALVERSLDALFDEGLYVAPHIIIGLDGKIKGEYNALEILKKYPINILEYVVLMPAVAMKNDISPIPISDVLNILIEGRLMYPDIEQSLGCARPRGDYRYILEVWALRAGINRMALWSDIAVEEAEKLGLDISYRYTCCSVSI